MDAIPDQTVETQDFTHTEENLFLLDYVSAAFL